MLNRLGLWFAVCWPLACAAAARADVALPPVFSDHMVLQREMAAPVWGAAAPDEEITVSLGEHTVSTRAGADGKWSLKLKPLPAGGPHVLTIRGKNVIEIRDVLVGEVWIGSGQSNMAGGVGGYLKGDETLAKLAEQTYPKLRLCKGGGGRWQEATPQNIKNFSALLFAFGQRLQQELDVPVGLIVGAVGGTPSGRWLTAEMLAADALCQQQIRRHAEAHPFEQQLAEYQRQQAAWEQAAAAAKAAGKQPPKPPAAPTPAGEARGGKIGDLYAAHIEPVRPYGTRGVLWDQGEGGTALEGVDQFAAMGALMRGWRGAWGQGEFPFLYVQKPSGGGCAWDYADPTTAKAEPFAALPAAPKGDGVYRELHIRLRKHPQAAMVTASDLGAGIHPVNKSGYGRRAARVALGFVYGRPVEICGPVYASHAIEGDKLRVTFSHVGQGLAWKHGERLQGFEIAGADGVFHWASAAIDGDTVVLSSEKTPEPKAARYAWANQTPWANLFNKDGLPALTFQTE